MKLRRILVPVDFSVATANVLQYAEAFARQHNAAMILLHVAQPDRSKEKTLEEIRGAGEEQLRKLAEVLWGDMIATEVIVVTGKPYQQIVNGAKEMFADLIIMGSVSAIGAWGMFRRNTLTRVTRAAPCPVLVVHPIEQQSVRDPSHRLA